MSNQAKHPVTTMSQTKSTTVSAKNNGGLAWIGGLVAGLLVVVLVGLTLYFYVSSSSQASTIAALESTLAQMQSGPPENAGPPPSTVKVAQVVSQEMQQRVMVVGRLMEVKRSVVASEVEGRVTALLTPAGRTVVGGETVMARVDSVWSDLAVEQAQADLASAKATAQQSARELKLLEGLAARNATDPQAIDDARAKAESDAANVMAYEAALHRAEETRQRVEIIAPFDGIVSAKLTEKGQWLDPGSPVVEVVSNGEIDAVIDVPESIIAQVPKGTEVELTIEAINLTLTGEVIAINPDGSNAARTYPVKVRVDDRDGLLKVGMSVTARVPISEKKQYLVVPRSAVQYDTMGPRLWLSLVMPSSAPGSMPQAMPMDVDVLFGVGDAFAVEPRVAGDRLNPGMDVVIEGAERLFPTARMIVMGGGKPGDPSNVAPSDVAPSGDVSGDDAGAGNQPQQ